MTQAVVRAPVGGAELRCRWAFFIVDLEGRQKRLRLFVSFAPKSGTYRHQWTEGHSQITTTKIDDWIQRTAKIDMEDLLVTFVPDAQPSITVSLFTEKAANLDDAWDKAVKTAQLSPASAHKYYLTRKERHIKLDSILGYEFFLKEPRSWHRAERSDARITAAEHTNAGWLIAIQGANDSEVVVRLTENFDLLDVISDGAVLYRTDAKVGAFPVPVAEYFAAGCQRLDRSVWEPLRIPKPENRHDPKKHLDKIRQLAARLRGLLQREFTPSPEFVSSQVIVGPRMSRGTALTNTVQAFLPFRWGTDRVLVTNLLEDDKQLTIVCFTTSESKLDSAADATRSLTQFMKERFQWAPGTSDLVATKAGKVYEVKLVGSAAEQQPGERFSAFVGDHLIWLRCEK